MLAVGWFKVVIYAQNGRSELMLLFVYQVRHETLLGSYREAQESFKESDRVESVTEVGRAVGDLCFEYYYSAKYEDYHNTIGGTPTKPNLPFRYVTRVGT